MTKDNIRKEFLNFFKSKDHTLVPSDSLVPSSDPSLLFTSAGMVQFKAHFLRQIPLTFVRATSSQRCLRTTDIEQVGQTPRHLTMFEMLGNFSFGDYFKEDTIAWAWEFLTKNLNLSEKHLWPTVYKDDDDAFNIWKKLVPANKIKRMGDDTNFWTMGPTGPCGPCSEIYWDLEERASTDGPDDSDRWMEIWNLVFTQYDRQENGKLEPLPKKNIDTGMGLERLTSVVEGVESNFQTSLFKPILELGQDLFQYKIGKDAKKDVALKIFSDHLRAVTLLVFDGILPSNEGRGYVLRRLLRRAVRQGTLFGLKEPFLFKGIPLITDLFKETADQLPQRKEAITEIVKQEEERFLETIETGSTKLNHLVQEAKKSKKKAISGKDVFRLYDTYGFPPELTKEILAEESLSFDDQEFGQAQTEAQDMAREGWKGSGAKDITVYNELVKKNAASQFKGYETLEVQCPVQVLLKEGRVVDSLKEGESGELITSQTPFYPEGGGQVGDRGWVKNPQTKDIMADVLDTQKPTQGLIVHLIQAKTSLKKDQTILLHVDPNHREPTKRHHTATHLLHAALRSILGKTVTQAGSLVAPDRLRFDYTYNKPLTPEQIQQIEDRVNEAILKNMDVTPQVFSADQAKKMGAMALFGEKYGNEVRCLLISDKGFDQTDEAFSLELCGGTHVSASGDIGGFKIVSDASIAAGVRRMEAVAGHRTIDYVRKMEKTVKQVADSLKSTPDQLESRINKILDKQKQLEQEIRDLKIKVAQGGDANNSSALETQSVNGINLAMKVSEGLETKDLRVLADRLKQQVKSGVVFVASVVKDEDREKVSFIFALTPDMKDKGLHAGQLAKSMAQELGGSGGGRPDFAQGGGQSKEKLSSAIKKIPGFLTQKN